MKPIPALSLLLPLAALLLLACVPVATPAPAVTPTPAVAPTPPPTPAPKMGGTLRFVPHADIKALDPIWTTAYMTRNYAYMVYDVLLAWDAEAKIQPQMVHEWKVSPDGMSYTFTLRDGLAWHDGRPVTAEDVVASLGRWGKRDAIGKMLMASTESLKAVDAKSFTLKLKEPFGLVLDALGKPSSNLPVIMPKEVAATDPFTAIESRVGSGPYKFLEWRPGDRISYVRNEAYKPRPEPPSGLAGAKLVYLDRVDWLYIPDRATQTAGIGTAEFDYVEEPSRDDYDRVRAMPRVVTFADPFGLMAWGRPNHKHPPFDNKLARQALQAAADQRVFLMAGIGPERLWKTCTAYFGCGGKWETHVGSEGWLKADLAKGKELLKQSGYDGRTIVMITASDLPHHINMALPMKSLLESLGAKVDLQVMDWAGVVARRAIKKPVAEGGWNYFETSWDFFDISTPAANTGVAGTCDVAWPGWYCSEKMEMLRKQWAQILNPKEQMRLVEEIQRLAYDEVPYVNLGQWFRFRAWRDYVKGVIPHSIVILWNIWLDK